MELPVNTFKRALAAGRPRIGLWSQLTSSIAIEIVAHAGFDFVVIDTERAPNDVSLVVARPQAVAVGSDVGLLASHSHALADRFPR